MQKPFESYMRLREAGELPARGVTATIKLQKRENSREFTPFVVDDDNHPGLAKIISAFLDSDKVPVGYSTIERDKGEVMPTLKRKSLWLTGGSVRDHLLGKTIRNYDIVTDATPSEIKLILRHAGFIQSDHPQAPPKNPMMVSRGKSFHGLRFDSKGKPVEFQVEVKGQKFNLAPLSKSPKSRLVSPGQGEFTSSVEEDAANRDFTINAMYIPLNKADGPNSELIDVFGGANHLRSGELKAVDDGFDGRMREDPHTGLRALNMADRYAGGKLPEPYMDAIRKSGQLLNRDQLRSMFVRGVESPDGNPSRIVKSYHDAGLLNGMFPNCELSTDFPGDMRPDRWTTTAYILKDENPEIVGSTLKSCGWSQPEARDISYLVKLGRWAKNRFDPEQFVDMADAHNGLTKSKIRDFLGMIGQGGPMADKFIDFESGDLSPYQQDGLGRRTLNPVYIRFLGRTPRGPEFDSVRRQLMLNRWKGMAGD